MNRTQWKKAHHLARLATCIDPAANTEQQAEVQAFQQLQQLIQRRDMTRADFRAAGRCVDAHRYPHDKLDRSASRLRQLRHRAALRPRVDR